MRIGLITPPDQIGNTPLEALLQQVVQAEQDGFASFWFVQLVHAGNDVLTTIALAGQRTQRIELGTAVVPVYVRHPLTLAQQAATTQLAVGGRLTLGVGLSHRPVVENVLGLSYDRPARYMQEYLSILQPLVNQAKIAFSGEVFKVEAGLQVPGAPATSVLIAALAPRMLRIAGELADGTITWMAGIKTLKNHIVPRINAAAAAAGRPKPRVCAALPVAVTDDLDEARAYAASALQRYGQLENYRRLLDIEGAAGPEDVALVGTEAEVAAQLKALAAAGTTDFLASIFPVGADQAASWSRTWDFLRQVNSIRP